MRESAEFRVSLREKLFKEQEGICVYCKSPIKEKPSLDHIIPVFAGNGIGEENFVVCHERCNKQKGDYIIFSNLFDREIYQIIDIPFFFKWDYIQTNNTKKGHK